MAQQHHDRRIRVRVWERVDGKTDLDVIDDKNAIATTVMVIMVVIMKPSKGNDEARAKKSS